MRGAIETAVITIAVAATRAGYGGCALRARHGSWGPGHKRPYRQTL